MDAQASTITLTPGMRRPSCSARSIIRKAILSWVTGAALQQAAPNTQCGSRAPQLTLMEPPAEKASTLTSRLHLSPASLRNLSTLSKGVLPIRSRIVSIMATRVDRIGAAAKAVWHEVRLGDRRKTIARDKKEQRTRNDVVGDGDSKKVEVEGNLHGMPCFRISDIVKIIIHGIVGSTRL